MHATLALSSVALVAMAATHVIGVWRHVRCHVDNETEKSSLAEGSR